MKTIRPYLSILITGVIVFFLIKPLAQTHAQLKDMVSIHIQWRWLLCSFLCLLFYSYAYLFPFVRLLSGITQRQVSFRDVFTLFHLANITRYLPGRIWGVVRLLSLGKRFGLNKTALGGSLTLHVGIETALSGIISVPLLFSKYTRNTVQDILDKTSGHALLLPLAVIGIIVCLLFFVPTLLNRTRRFLKILCDTSKPLFEKSFRTHWLNVILIHTLVRGCHGFAFYLFVRSFASVPISDVGTLTACYAFAWICGFLSFLTPGGLGIREGLLALLLANYMPVPKAMLVAMLCRIWTLAAEIVLAGVAFILNTVILKTNDEQYAQIGPVQR